jgi:poly(A) polymerase Pap1
MAYDPYTPKYEFINDKYPTKKEKLENERLKAYMDREIVIESEAEWRRKNDVLEEISQIFKQWVKSVAISERGMSEEEAREVGGRLLLSGSYRLNIRYLFQTSHQSS